MLPLCPTLPHRLRSKRWPRSDRVPGPAATGQGPTICAIASRLAAGASRTTGSTTRCGLSSGRTSSRTGNCPMAPSRRCRHSCMSQPRWRSASSSSDESMAPRYQHSSRRWPACNVRVCRWWSCCPGASRRWAPVTRSCAPWSPSLLATLSGRPCGGPGVASSSSSTRIASSLGMPSRRSSKAWPMRPSRSSGPMAWCRPNCAAFDRAVRAM